MTALQISFAALLSTAAGGLCALCLRERLRAALGFTAGVVLGVACFELLPESFELSHQAGGAGGAALAAPLAGFLLFHGLARLARKRQGREAGCVHAGHPGVGLLSAAALAGHSFTDGVAMGLAFQVSPAAGIAVAVAVITHDFCDGLNTVGLMIRHGNSRARALGMLALDAAAPLFGAAASSRWHVPPETLAPYLGFFAGSLLYVGASILLARAGAEGGARRFGSTALGASLVYVLVRAAG